jgi:hypothetical protein
MHIHENRDLQFPFLLGCLFSSSPFFCFMFFFDFFDMKYAFCHFDIPSSLAARFSVLFKA